MIEPNIPAKRSDHQTRVVRRLTVSEPQTKRNHMIVHTAWLGSPPQLLEITTAIICDLVSEEARIHVGLTQPEPTGFADAGRQRRQPFQFEFDPQSWTVTLCQPTTAHQAVVADFLHSLPPSHREALQEMAKLRRNAYCQLKSRSASAELRGAANLVYWTEFEAENNLPETMLDQFSDGLRSYMVTDCYCLKPGCDCRSASLVFHRINPENMSAEDVCLAKLPFDNGELKLQQIRGDRVEAMTMTGRWQLNRSELFLPELQWRYAKLRGSTATGPGRRVDSGAGNSHRAKGEARRKKRKTRRR